MAENNHQSGVKTFGHEMHVQMDGTTINNSGSRKRTYEERVFSRLRFRICVLVFIYLNNK